MADGRCIYWQLEVNDGPYDPLFGIAGSLIASMGSIAAGVGSVLAAPPKALYTAASKRGKATDSDTSSIFSTKSGDSARKTAFQNLSGGTEMRVTLSDPSDMTSHSHRTDSMRTSQFKEDVGSKGLGRVIKSTIDGTDFSEIGLNSC